MELKVVFLLRLLNHLSNKKEEWLYLRNYEDLPHSVGNDVDLLVKEGRRNSICEIVKNFAKSSGWTVTKVVHFSPLTIFLSNGTESLHIDLFDRMEWHFLPFADVSGLMEDRVFKNGIWILDAGSESFINVMTRHLYEGVVRNKHREQFGLLDKTAQEKFSSLLRAMTSHDASRLLTHSAISGDWKSFEKGFRLARRGLLSKCVLRKQAKTLSGVFRYVTRSVKRTLFPPGELIVFEGSDWSEDSKIMRQCATEIRDQFSCAGPMYFQGKSTRITQNFESLALMRPPEVGEKRIGLSCFFLLYHWLGFQYFYWCRVRPQLVRNRLVIGNKYTYNLFLTPSKFRLAAPQWILMLGVSLMIKPKLALFLKNSKSTSQGSRKMFTSSDLREYDIRLTKLAKKNKEVRLLSMGENSEVTCKTILEMSKNIIT